jgi:hypothetical protein
VQVGKVYYRLDNSSRRFYRKKSKKSKEEGRKKKRLEGKTSSSKPSVRFDFAAKIFPKPGSSLLRLKTLI